MKPRSRRTLGLALALVALAAGAGAGLAGARAAQERPAVPEDTLPRPLVRSAPPGAEAYEAGWTASDDEVELGRALFFEPGLSKDGTIACASCHRPELAFADDLRLSLGVDGQPTTRNTPSLFNKVLSTHVNWDGSAATLEDQVLAPIDNPAEMALGVDGAVAFLNGHRAYSLTFVDTYGGEATRERLAAALAAFVRALVVGDSPIDRFRRGEGQQLTAAERAGLWLYEGRGRCWKCHNGPNFSDESFHNTGVGVTDGAPESGRFAVTGDEADRGAFRTPGLRLLTQSAPYMHDGSLGTLTEVVEFYRKGGNANASRSPDLQPLDLTDEDVAHLVAFLEALSR